MHSHIGNFLLLRPLVRTSPPSPSEAQGGLAQAMGGLNKAFLGQIQAPWAWIRPPWPGSGLGGETDRWTDRQMDGPMDKNMEIHPRVLQDIGPFGPLLKKAFLQHFTAY